MIHILHLFTLMKRSSSLIRCFTDYKIGRFAWRIRLNMDEVLQRNVFVCQSNTYPLTLATLVTQAKLINYPYKDEGQLPMCSAKQLNQICSDK